MNYLKHYFGSWKRILVTFQEHGKKTLRAHHEWLHDLPNVGEAE